ncbi:MAG: arsenate reductase (glutaredoxin) [Litorimonas sp.]
MSKLTIWHNPRCSKSRQTLALIEQSGHDVEILRYLEDNPSLGEIEIMLSQLGLKGPRDMMRTGEAIYKDLDLVSEDRPDVLLAAMAQHSILIERPIVSNGTRAIIGRPPEAVKELL